MIFLSKNGKDEYVNMFAYGCGTKPVDTTNFDFNASRDPIVLRGILNKVITYCQKSDRNFWYIDSGYFGNSPSIANPHGWKHWHRIVPNNLQHSKIIERPSDRWEKLQIKLQPRKYGSKIIVAAPDEKPCKFYKIDQQQWIDQTVATLKRYTDRPIIVRQRAAKREDRVLLDPLSRVLADDVHAVVTYNSVAAVESVIAGVPVFTLAPVNAADPVASQGLANIDEPTWPDDLLRSAWAHHLAYGQFHINEMRNGQAHKILFG
jgi:hypothetical protein